jgi:hypothetical protein
MLNPSTLLSRFDHPRLDEVLIENPAAMDVALVSAHLRDVHVQKLARGRQKLPDGEVGGRGFRAFNCGRGAYHDGGGVACGLACHMSVGALDRRMWLSGTCTEDDDAEFGRGACYRVGEEVARICWGFSCQFDSQYGGAVSITEDLIADVV